MFVTSAYSAPDAPTYKNEFETAFEDEQQLVQELQLHKNSNDHIDFDPQSLQNVQQQLKNNSNLPPPPPLPPMPPPLPPTKNFVLPAKNVLQSQSKSRLPSKKGEYIKTSQ